MSYALAHLVGMGASIPYTNRDAYA